MTWRQKIAEEVRHSLGIHDLKEEWQRKILRHQSLVYRGLSDHLPLTGTDREWARQEIASRYGCRHFVEVVHKNDLMYFHHLRKVPQSRAQALFHYYNVGLDTLHKIQQAWPGFAPQKIWDFGSGYGRMSRFLPHFFPEAEVRVSDVKAQAMDFQREVLGFSALVHGPEPFAEEQPHHFDLIMALSVLSHLPQALSARWVKLLYAHLRPGGRLFATFNGIRYAGEAGQEDYCFIPQSEDAGMPWVEDHLEDSGQYGSTFYSAARLCDWLQKTTGRKPHIWEDFSGRQDAFWLQKPGDN